MGSICFVFTLAAVIFLLDMIKFSYHATKPLIKEGARRHLSYRYPVRNILGPALGILAVLMGGFILTMESSFEYRLIGVFTALMGVISVV